MPCIHRPFIFRILLSLALLLPLAAQTAAPARAQRDASGPAVTLREDGLDLVWDFSGAETWPAAGVSVLVALPPEAAPTWTVATDGAFWTPGELKTETDQPLPEQRAALEELGDYRGIRLARVTVWPALPAENGLNVVSRASLSVNFGAALPPETPLESAARAALNWVVNPTQARAASRPELLTPQAASARVFLEVTQPGIYQASYAAISAAGLDPNGALKLTYHGASAAYARDAANSRLLFYAAPFQNRWTTTDAYVLTDESGGSTIGARSAAPAGEPAGKAWATQHVEQNKIYYPASYRGVRVAGWDGDWWVWEALSRNESPVTKSYSFNLENVDATQAATLKLWMIGYSSVAAADPDHYATATINLQASGSVQWDGKALATLNGSIPANTLSANNTLALTLADLPGVAFQDAYLDAFQVRYALGSGVMPSQARFEGEPTTSRYTVNLPDSGGALAWDVTDPLNPTALTGFTFSGGAFTLADPAGISAARAYALANESTLFTANARAAASAPAVTSAYVAIAPAAYHAALAPLLALRGGQAVDLQAIYDAFADGRPEPAAIHDFLDQLSPLPEYVLLVGDGNVDPKNYTGKSPASVLPPYLEPDDPSSGEFVADILYVTLGPSSDRVPDILLGRLPANSTAELETMVGKIVAYETAPEAGLWQSEAVFVADNTDSAGNFAAINAQMSALIPAQPNGPRSILMNYTDPPSGWSTAQKTAWTQAMRDAVDARWNNGAGLMVFTGHSSVHQWAAEEFIHYNDVANLTNGGRQPIVLALTCLTSSYQMPYIEDQRAVLQSLDEALVRKANGGAIAVFGSTGTSVLSMNDLIGSSFITNVYQQQPVGLAAQAGLISLLSNASTSAHLVQAFVLLGDPALKIANDFTQISDVFLPVVSR